MHKAAFISLRFHNGRAEKYRFILLPFFFEKKLAYFSIENKYMKRNP